MHLPRLTINVVRIEDIIAGRVDRACQRREFGICIPSRDPLLVDLDGVIVDFQDLIAEKQTKQNDEYVEAREQVIDAMPFGRRRWP